MTECTWSAWCVSARCTAAGLACQTASAAALLRRACAQVRDFEYNAEKQASQRDSAEQMKQDAEKKRGSLEQWSASAYGEVSCEARQTRLLSL